MLDRQACLREGLPVMRRHVGGSTTYLDREQPFYQFVFHHSRVPAKAAELYAYLLGAPVRALRRLGVPAVLRDGNEIEVEGRRIAGIGGGHLGEAAVVVGNILCGFDFTALPRVWNAPSLAFRELAGIALRERLITLRDLEAESRPEPVTAVLRESLAEALGRPVIAADLTDEEWTRTEALESRLRHPEFLALHAERGDGALRRLKIAAGAFIHAETVEWRGRPARLALLVRNERIEAVRMDGAQDGEQPALEAALRGCPAGGWRAQLAAA
jgi:lipoate-protein ligase A